MTEKFLNYLLFVEVEVSTYNRNLSFQKKKTKLDAH